MSRPRCYRRRRILVSTRATSLAPSRLPGHALARGRECSARGPSNEAIEKARRIRIIDSFGRSREVRQAVKVWGHKVSLECNQDSRNRSRALRLPIMYEHVFRKQDFTPRACSRNTKSIIINRERFRLQSGTPMAMRFSRLVDP